MMKKFNLIDNTLYYLNTNIYQNSLVSDRPPNFFNWVATGGEHNFYTYQTIGLANPIRPEENSLILLESSAIIPDHIQYIRKNHRAFSRIYTHNSTLLQEIPDKCRWIPGGGVWIGTNWGGGGEIKVYEKSKFCSFFSSGKDMCRLHGIRTLVFNGISKGYNVDRFKYTDKFVKPIEYLKDYMFSIIIENYIDDLYFTEKILNCFACGTVPIYYGARNIDSIFDKNGIIQCESIGELLFSLENIKGCYTEEYISRIEAIYNNLETVQNYTTIEDYIWRNHL